MKYIVLDLSMRGREHVFFNSAFLKMLRIISEERIEVYADQSHCMNLKNELDQSFVLFPLRILSHESWRCVFSDIFSSYQCLKVLFRSNRTDCIILLNRLPLTLLIYNVVNFFFKRKTLSVIHGEMESIVNFKNVQGLTKFYYQLFKLGYICSRIDTSYLVLGASIMESIKVVKFGKAKIFSIDHPYDYTLDIKSNENFEQINIGIIGSALLRKNSHLIFELAQKYRNTDSLIKNIRFLIVGRVDDNILKYSNQYVTFNKTNEMYTSLEYASRIYDIHYSLQFYDQKTNLALASGSFFDSLKYEKPIIAIKGNPFVDYYFNISSI